MVQLDIDHNEIERRKQFYRDVFDYRPVDHLPIFIWMMGFQGEGSSEYTLRSELENLEVQFDVNVRAIKRALKVVPDDYIPTVRITQGYMTIATMFGMDIHWSDDPNQPPGSDGHIIDDLEEVYSLRRPTMDDGVMPENIRRLRYFHDNLPPDVYLTGIDNGGPLNSLKDLLDTNLLYLGFHDNPEAMHHLLNLVTDVQLEMCHKMIETAGGDINRFACIDFDPLWHPEQYKSFCSDDVCATIGPDIFAEFSAPYNNRLYEPWGSGGFHNCGPNPCLPLYMAHTPKVKYLNCSYRFSHQEFPEMREPFSGWGVIEAMFDMEETPEDMLEGYRTMMETLAPDTVGIPYCIVDDTWSDDDITGFYWDMRKVAEEYAANVRWVGDKS